jgi:hypothetical protein
MPERMSASFLTRESPAGGLVDDESAMPGQSS